MARLLPGGECWYNKDKDKEASYGISRWDAQDDAGQAGF